MKFTSEQLLDGGVLEREFHVGDVPGVLWTASDEPAPLVLVGHPGGFHKRLPMVVARARHYATVHGFAVAAIDAPGCGERTPSTADEQARAELRRAGMAGEPVEELVLAMIGPLVDRAVPEWQATLDALLALPGMSGAVGYDGMIAIGIRLAAVDRRIRAAAYFGQTFVPQPLREEARGLTIPVQFLMQWDDAGMDRQPVLDLFDAFGSTEKTLHANLGGHAGTPWFEVEDAGRFFARHLT